MPSSITRQVIHQVSTGDREAFRILFNAYYSRVWHFADKVLNDSLYADEVAQLVFLGIWQKRKTLNPDLNFENFLYVLSRHAVIDFIRMNRRATMTVGLDAVDVRGGIQIQIVLLSIILSRNRLRNWCLPCLSSAGKCSS